MAECDPSKVIKPERLYVSNVDEETGGPDYGSNRFNPDLPLSDD